MTFIIESVIGHIVTRPSFTQTNISFCLTNSPKPKHNYFIMICIGNKEQIITAEELKMQMFAISA